MKNPDEQWLDRVRAAADTLEAIGADWGALDRVPQALRERLHRAVARLHEPNPAVRRQRARASAKAVKAARIGRVEERLHETGIRALRRRPIFTTPNILPPAAFTPNDVPPGDDSAAPAPQAPASTYAGDLRNCYVCKRSYGAVHHFYDQLCQACGDFNFAKRAELVDLSGRVALVTGGRVKIGYQASLKLLRAGATVIVTTRFPRDSARRYAAEPDFTDWADRVEVFGLDLRHTPSVEAFCHAIASTRRRLDFIVNNACQTVRRPPQFYAHMMAVERAAHEDMPREVRRLLTAYEDLRAQSGARPRAGATTELTRGDLLPGLASAAELSQVALLSDDGPEARSLFPSGALDQDLQQVDLRGRNSWRLLLHEVSAVELLEVQLVNAVAPFIINARLRALMCRTANRDKHIVNVSAMEGQFYRPFKTTRHPHTNMAKAALNMMTRTSATDYHQDGIHMNSVDTGWVTDEDPREVAERKTAEQRFHPPLDIVDGAARIVDPIITGIRTGTHVWGQFLKDYQSTPW